MFANVHKSVAIFKYTCLAYLMTRSLCCEKHTDCSHWNCY